MLIRRTLFGGGDYYSRLGVTRGANEKEVKAAFQRLAKKLHPDMHMQKTEVERAKIAEAFREAKEAYEVLSNAARRVAYDRDGRAGVDYAARSASAASSRRGAYGYSSAASSSSMPRRSIFELVFAPILRGFSAVDAGVHLGMAAFATLGFVVVGSLVENSWRRNNSAKLFDEDESRKLGEIRRLRRRREAAAAAAAATAASAPPPPPPVSDPSSTHG